MTDRTTEADTPQEQVQADDSAQDSSKDWEAEYKQLQAEFTRKSQRLAELEKQSQQSNSVAAQNSDEEEQLKTWLRKNGFVSKDELQQQLEQTKLETGFNDVLNYYPDLKKHEKAIKDLQASNPGMSYEEIAINYGFTSSDKLNKAKEARQKMMGTDSREPARQKSITDMSPAEYEKWKEENGVAYSAGLVKSG